MRLFSGVQKAAIVKESIIQAENRSDEEVQLLLEKKKNYRDQLLEQIRQNQERRAKAGSKEREYSLEISPKGMNSLCRQKSRKKASLNFCRTIKN